MSMIPSNLARVPSFLASRIALGSLGRTNSALLNTQTSLSSGRSINRASDDPIRASSILSLNDRAHRTNLHRQNLSFAQNILDTLESPLANTQTLVNEMYNLASGELTLGEPGERQAMAATVESAIRTLLDNANFSSQGLYLLGGSTPTSPPVTRTSDGAYRYTARGSGLLSDLGIADQIPLTLGGDTALGETSARQRGTLDLNPALTATTRLSDLRGARGLGVTPGAVQFNFNGGPAATVDLTGATTVGEVNTRLAAAIAQYETDNSVTILGPFGVDTLGESINIDVVAGGTLTFFDAATGSTAADLGLSQAAFTPVNANGAATDPRLTLDSPLTALSGVNLPLDSIRIRFRRNDGTGTSVDVDLSAVNTIDDLRNAIEVSAPGVRVEINSAGTGLDITSELAGRTVSVEDIAGGFSSAQQLGIRTFASDTPISVFNNGRGVEIVDGKTDQSGAYDRDLNTDFRVTLGNGQHFDVDLRPQDMTDVSTLLARINAEFASQLGTQPNPAFPVLAAGQFDARISAGPNGIALFSSLAGPIEVDTLNNSGAAEHLGLKTLTLETATGEYVAQDRAGVRVNNLFTNLVDLRDALLRNDTSGIQFAAQGLRAAQDRLTSAQAIVGSRSQRLSQHLERLEDNDVLDKKILSSLQDTDFAEASVKLSSLSLQLQATLQSIGAVQGRTLFDFLS
ncbi:MAG TPA: flagellin [Phycisphaerales bacterium]|nr:flagellin [Phycisphaerales bacterium]